MHRWNTCIPLKNLAPILFFGVIFLALPSTSVFAQNNPVVEKTAEKNAGPAWSELSIPQQQALKPLTKLWPTMTAAHKRKWLVVSQNFIQRSDQEQITIQSRMQEWAALSPQQRAPAKFSLAAQQARPVGGGAPAIKPVASDKLASPPSANGNKALPRIASNQAAPSTLLPNTSTQINAPVPESAATH